MRNIFAIIGVITVIYYLFRGFGSKRKTSDSDLLFSDAVIEQSATAIIATLNTLSNKSLNDAMSSLDEYGIDYEWEPWEKIVWKMDDVPNVTFEKDKTSVSAHSTTKHLSGLYAKIWAIVDNERVISDTSKSTIAVRLESSASNYERLLYAKLIELGAEVMPKK